MPYKDPDKQRSWQREYQRRKRAGLPTKGISPRKLLTEEEKKRRQKESSKRYREKFKKQVSFLIGNKCIICGRDYKLISHRKDGIDHSTGSNGMAMVKDVINEPTKFVRLCWNCHKGVHWVMKYFDMDWDETIERLKYLDDI